ncbi:hypothetical protein [Prosthecobacter vanneervenii]|uniref:Uncharacterized protein n=1 Tax=Prosthecobacter vanneervenii TaxID=48466 RepID=A0A7W8DLX8_9BACT|nr:hypothetical protein [Prosthecobacter vanneervenii]MBB5034311.1 hypothetical protein [Prosthecobacter vanneervenii]
MRLSHYALALTIILLAITGYLAWEAQEEAKGARKELELVRKQQAAHEAAMPAKPVTVAELPPPPVAPPPSTVPPLAGSSLMPGTPAPLPSPPPAAAPLTDLQKQILGMPAFAKVVESHTDQGFAVINVGKDKQLTPGMKFDVRRGNGLVGRVSVGETIEAAEAVVDIDNTIVIPGVRIEAGDELILPVRK